MTLAPRGPFGADDFLARDGRAWLGKCLGG